MSVYSKEQPNNLRISIQSMLDQTIAPGEIVLVEDGPLSSELKNVIEEFSGNPIMKVVSLKENVGLGKALNVGLLNCKYDIVARMDTDDISDSIRCEKQLNVLINQPGISVVGTAVYEFIGDPSNIVALKVAEEESNKILKLIKYKNPMNHPTVMFKKQDVIRSGNYQGWYLNEDYFLWIRMILNGYKLININQPLVSMRITNETYMRRGGLKYYMTQQRLFKYMFKQGVITYPQYIFNNLIRFIVRVLVANIVRKLLYQFFLRKMFK